MFLLFSFSTTLAGNLRDSLRNESGFFHRKGNQIIDPAGNAFQIKGANVSCWLYQENYVLGGAQTAQKVTAARLTDCIGEQAYLHYLKSMMDSFLVEEDLAVMKKIGLNCIRIGFDATLFNSDSTTQWFFKSIDRLLPALKRFEMAILPIMIVPPKPPDKLWCTGYVKGDTLLWDSPSAKRRTIEIWRTIARHFKNEKQILGYDLLGEPSIPNKREKELIDFYRDITAAIRAEDPNHMLVYEGNNYAIDLDVLARYDAELDANASYSFHFYSWLGLKLKNHMPKFMKSARLRDRPVFCGEWGINRISTLTEQIGLMNEAGDMDGWIIYMWKAIELPTGKEAKKRPPYYGNWFFIPFEELHMSLLTFKLDDETRDVIDWISDVRNSIKPEPDKAKEALQKIVQANKLGKCKFDNTLIKAIGLKEQVP